MGKIPGRRWPLITAATAAPVLTCLIMVPFRRHLVNTSAALVLVLVVVAVAVAGNRLAGAVTAVSAGVSFDFFLTRPYQRFTIATATDVQTTLLLLAVGLAVTEIAHWGYRQRAVASQRAGYLDGIEAAAAVAAAGTTSPSALVKAAAEQIKTVLHLTRCRFDYATGVDHPRLQPDGSVRWHEQVWDVEHDGLPRDKDTELPVSSGGRLMGRYLLTADPRTRSSRAERLVAVAIAAQVGAGLRS